MANAGRILIMPQGKYDSNKMYEMLDMVSHGGKGWICKQHCLGIEPSDENSEFWAECIDVSGDVVGYHASDTFGAEDMQNVTEGSIEITSRNGVVTMCVQNLSCTADAPLMDVSAIVGEGYSISDKGGTGFYIEDSVLHSAKATIDNLVFTFAL
jgi:hypothetical protein